MSESKVVKVDLSLYGDLHKLENYENALLSLMLCLYYYDENKEIEKILDRKLRKNKLNINKIKDFYGTYNPPNLDTSVIGTWKHLAALEITKVIKYLITSNLF